MIDLGGQLAIPGFIEGHGHFTGIGENRINLDLMATKSWDEIVQMVAQAVEKARPGQWIIGRGWHQEKWSSVPQPNVEGFPTHAVARQGVAEQSCRPHARQRTRVVRESEGDGALEHHEDDGESERRRDPEGRERQSDRACCARRRRASCAAAQASRGRRQRKRKRAARRVLELADQEVTSKGITSFVDAGSSFDTIERMKRMVDEGKLNVRLWVMVSDSTAPAFGAGLDSHRMIGYGNDHLTVRAIKLYIDGALGSRGAWLLEPYADKPDSTGLNTTPLETIRAGAQTAIEHNYQVCIHAIGDRANREVLNIYEETFKKNNKNGKDLRWRIEHAQHISAADIPRFGQLGVIASMQTVHCTSDAVFVPARLGDKRSEEGAYVWQKLMKSGAVVANGTDAPVENVDPIPNYYAAVTRKLADGRVFYGDQKMSRMEALRSYTMANAFATFEENVKGSLTVGKLADITVLTKDITKVPDEEIRTAKVAYTIVGGKVVYQAK